MENSFDICGVHLNLDDITQYRMVQREYIYQPTYKEKPLVKRMVSKAKYEFYKMVPFAAIVNDEEYSIAVKKAKANGLKESIGKDLAVAVISTVANKFNIKELKYKKYKCVNVSGRVFTTYLEDVPAIIFREDGKISNVYKNDDIYPLLGEPIAPVILTVPALTIITNNETLIFYGNSIQLDNVEEPYCYLRNNIKNDNLIESNKPLKLPRILFR